MRRSACRTLNITQLDDKSYYAECHYPDTQHNDRCSMNIEQTHYVEKQAGILFHLSSLYIGRCHQIIGNFTKESVPLDVCALFPCLIATVRLI